MQTRFEYGEAVRVLRNVRNDGTYPGEEVGALLVRRGSVGYVRDVGTFLQDQIIYSVDFLEAGRRVGCREEELQLASEPWTPSRFEFRDKVKAGLDLAVNGEIIVAKDTQGEVMKVVRDAPGGVAYHVHFMNGRVFQVPETALASFAGSGAAEEEEEV